MTFLQMLPLIQQQSQGEQERQPVRNRPGPQDLLSADANQGLQKNLEICINFCADDKATKTYRVLVALQRMVKIDIFHD